MVLLKRQGPLHRVPGADVSAAEEVLKAAALLIVPEDQTQRRAFESLMPYLYVLRNKGCSWIQLTNLLAECGFTLKPSTVRSYFGEMLATRLDICQARMNEQISLLAEIRKETHGADMSAIASRVTAVMDSKRMMAASKIDALFGGASDMPQSPARLPVPNSTLQSTVTRQPNAEQTSKGARPHQAPPAPESPQDSDGFGLLTLPTSSHKTANSPGFIGMDDENPRIPNLATTPRAQPTAPPAAASDGQKPQFRCCPLQPGITALKKRENNPPEIYLSGEMEHPAIAGLMLNMQQRLYGAALEYMDTDGEIRMETLEEKRFRVTWKKPIPMTSTQTETSFIKMDSSLFAQSKPSNN